MHVTAIIAAAGAGRRLGAEMPKQLIELGGRSMLQRCVETFVGHPRVADVVVVLPADLEPPEWLAAPVPRVRVVRGGERRQDSVANGFDALPESRRTIAFSMNTKGWSGQAENIRKFLANGDVTPEGGRLPHVPE